MVKKMVQGSRAVAEMVALCRPQVISAYPITPQTLIVEELSQMVADGALKAEFVNVESEHSAASLVLGASATGVRVYSATTSQGLLLMTEVLYNIAGMRLPDQLGIPLAVIHQRSELMRMVVRVAELLCLGVQFREPVYQRLARF